jgi:hypothetical protein
MPWPQGVQEEEPVRWRFPDPEDAAVPQADADAGMTAAAEASETAEPRPEVETTPVHGRVRIGAHPAPPSERAASDERRDPPVTSGPP